ncbi:hypothetical protein CLW00_101291 [Mongoliibacter ruber]|uniref:Uncharacterized protein n=1 Tax=Mongoliibacter ruber TaxID=1750599 RepID=A0A2T0WVC1_9BACT|nr:hypothetical protein CLW00_101291 [Mongoliibacter ruber]
MKKNMRDPSECTINIDYWFKNGFFYSFTLSFRIRSLLIKSIFEERKQF